MTDGSAESNRNVEKSSGFWRRLGMTLALLGLAVLLTAVALIGLLGGLPLVWVATSLVALCGSLIVGWVLYRLLRRLLWRVGRRLAFTYFLVGVLPAPMVLFLLVVGTYLMGGFFLGHLFREAVDKVHRDVSVAAEISLGQADMQAPSSTTIRDIAIAFYRGGRWTSGDPRAPEEWPQWLENRRLEDSDPLARPGYLPPLVELYDGTLSVAATAGDGNGGVVAFFDGHLETRLRELSGAWIELLRAGDEGSETVRITVLGEGLNLRPPWRETTREDRRAYLSRGGMDTSYTIEGFDVVEEVRSFDSGEVVGESLSASLAGTVSFLMGQLFSSSREVDTRAWLFFFLPAFLLFDVFAGAWLMAVLMIIGLSHAVNRLSRATSAVHSGDFSVRIPVRRKDQIGSLQTSFNQMAEGLERSVASLAQQESIEKELSVARELQKSLIPSEIIGVGDVEFATFFEPSAAIGGDYFDILPLDEDRLAVVIADVSGHGLSAGLRMAMLKAALLILVEQHDDAKVILQQLDRVVRTSQEGRLFVTATLALLDLRSGRMELTNAGHPPTYILQDDHVEEIVLPGAPLGAFDHSYGTAVVQLNPGDTVVWLSDGFIEATNPAGELFGYDRTVSCLEGSRDNPALVRDRLLGHVAEHTAGQPAEDDRTLVVMRYVPVDQKLEKSA